MYHAAREPQPLGNSTCQEELGSWRPELSIPKVTQRDRRATAPCSAAPHPVWRRCISDNEFDSTPAPLQQLQGSKKAKGKGLSLHTSSPGPHDPKSNKVQ